MSSLNQFLSLLSSCECWIFNGLQENGYCCVVNETMRGKLKWVKECSLAVEVKWEHVFKFSVLKWFIEKLDLQSVLLVEVPIDFIQMCTGSIIL